MAVFIASKFERIPFARTAIDHVSIEHRWGGGAIDLGRPLGAHRRGAGVFCAVAPLVAQVCAKPSACCRVRRIYRCVFAKFNGRCGSGFKFRK